MPVSGDVANTARSYPNCVFVRSCSPQLYLRSRLPRGITAGFLFTLRSSSLQLLGGDITTWLTPPSPRVSLRPLAGPWPCPSRRRDCRKGPAAVRVPAMEAPSSTLVAGWRRSRLLRPLAFALSTCRHCCQKSLPLACWPPTTTLSLTVVDNCRFFTVDSPWTRGA